MPRKSPSLSRAFALLASFGLAFAGTHAQARQITHSDARSDAPRYVHVLVEFDSPPAARSYAEALATASAKGSPDAHAEAANVSTTRVAEIDRAQQPILAAITAPDIGADILYRAQRVLNGIAIRVDTSKLAHIRALPGVRALRPIAPHVVDNSTSLPFIGSPELWPVSMADAGQGMRIGIIDTGIDYLHTDFGGPGTGYATNDPTLDGDVPGYPGVKVVGGYDFSGDAYDPNGSNPDNRLPVPDPDPMDCNGHGTHVAGTAAGFGVNADGSTFDGSYDSSTPLASMHIGPGAAPLASLYALKIFGCSGSTYLVGQAVEWAVDPNGDGDLSDHLDVVNLSVGSPYGFIEDVSSAACDNAALAGVVVVASAGNDGDTYYVTGSPGTADRVISVAASVDDGLISSRLRILAPASIAGLVEAPAAAFGSLLSTPGVTGRLVLANPSGGCGGLTNSGLIAGNVALVDRGTCEFTVKVKNAQVAGARGVVVVNNVEGEPFQMTGNDPSITIPSMMISKADGARIKQVLGQGVSVTLSSADDIRRAELADTLATFSSLGPRMGDSALKPDVAAPGLSITSAGAGTGSSAKILNGTSMASPHVAGSMALLRKLYPTWTVEEIKALLMNTAGHDVTVGTGGTPPRYGPGRVGAGRVDLRAAAASPTIAYDAAGSGRVSVSFGPLDVVGTKTAVRKVKVVNKSSSSVSFDVSYEAIVDMPGVDISFPGGSRVAVKPGKSRTFDVRLTATATAMKHTRDASVSASQYGLARAWIGEEAGYILLAPTTGGQPLRVPAHAVARPASKMAALQERIYMSAESGEAALDLTGAGVETGGDPGVDVTSRVTAFELQEINADDPSLSGEFDGIDIAYVGAASDARSQAGGLPDAFLYFGIATHGNWTTPNRAKFTVYVDTDGDGVDDYALFNGSGLPPGPVAAFEVDDLFFTKLVRLSDNEAVEYRSVNVIPPGEADMALFNTNVIVFQVAAQALGLHGGASSISYWVESFALTDDAVGDVLLVDHTGRHSFDVAAPGLDFGTGSPHLDLDGLSMPVHFDRQAFERDGSLGVLCFHHHNATGDRVHILATSVSGEPRITGAQFNGASFVVTGENFDAGSTILVDGRSYPTKNVPSAPTTTLTSKKAGKSIAPGASVALRVLKADGGVTAVFNYTRPPS